LAKISIDRALLKAKSHAKKGEIEEAKKLYQSVLLAFPKNVRAQQGLAGLGELTQAVINQLVALYNQGQLSEVVEQSEALLEQYPDAFIVWNLLGAAKKGLGRMDEAIVAYNKALILQPDYPDTYNNMGVTLREQGKLEEAIAAYERALSIKPDYAEAFHNMGNALRAQGKLDEAIAAYDKALSFKPDYAEARAHCLHNQEHICYWSAIEASRERVTELGIIGQSVSPFSVLSLEDAPERHRLRSELHARQKYPQRPLPAIAKPSRKPERLRIGYFSADFHNHATMHLMAQIFAVHDKSNFEIFAYSYGPDTQDKMREKLISDVDVFHDVRDMDDMHIVDLAREDNLSIAIDLKGFTQNTRLAPFSYGLAPVQISYLGYPGTLGTDFIDYIVADQVVIPDDKRQYYSERIIYLPNTYQPTDNTRIISEKVMTREDMGLPNEGFVFCCFNASYKISRQEFDIWMRLLGKVEDSVLWLLKSNKWAEQNLKREAKARGISAERLIFAEKAPHDEHLARQKLADLFLDTFNVNAHTTASDALWAGLPVLTKLGEGFAARVAASLLTAIGLPELITESEEAYEALALALATDPNELAKIKSKLEANRLTQPLFDSEMYTRHLETGYQMAYDRYFTGHTPDTIIVAA
jgi:protein O-GlcNAc transferase